MNADRKVQLVELEILKQIIALCVKHQIKYFAAWGTLLGAVRHKGFIPWDDDADLMMPRPDYDKFCEIAEKELEYPYFLQTAKTDSACKLHFAKVQNLETTFFEEGKPKDLHAGIFVDIFPIDGAPKSQKVRKRNKFRRRIYKYCALSICDYEKYFGKGIKRALGKIINVCFYGNQLPEYFYNKMEELYREIPYGTTGSVVDYSDVTYFDEELLQHQILLDFEDIKISCPLKYDELLTLCYGDYMTPPPEKKQIPRHGIFVDTENTYKKYI